MESVLIEQSHITTTIGYLLDKYQNDTFMLAKLHNYICIQLPTIMENIKRTHEERQQRIAELTVEQDEFMERFLTAHRYFYVSTTERFVSYDGKQYEVVSEDNILHHILTTITSEKQLMDWKQRTKVYMMKRIKDNSLIKSVPESKTIQRVIDHICPSLFETKQDAKYFLTIIGDSLFRKHGDLVHFIQPRAKAFLREIANSSLYIFGINTMNTFKYKYYDHNYSQCRLVKINDSVENENIWGNILRNVSLDMLCVAAHYSLRYGSADEYIARFSNEPKLETYTFFLKNTTQEQLVCRFIDEYLQVSLNGTTQYLGISPAGTPPNASNLLLSLSSTPVSQSHHLLDHNIVRTTGGVGGYVRDSTTRQISWKNMQYLWRHFLESQHLPTVIFQQNLKTMLTQKLVENYKEDMDCFIGVSSRFMPAIRAFIYFWETTISYEENGEYEIDELCMLYKRWLSMHKDSGKLRGGGDIPEHALVTTNRSDNGNLIGNLSIKERDSGINVLTEKQMLDLIMYYFPSAEIERDKYIFNIRCSLWDKQMDIQTTLYQMQDNLRVALMETTNPTTYCTTVYDAYIWYCKYYSDGSSEETPVYLIDDKMASTKNVPIGIGTVGGKQTAVDNGLSEVNDRKKHKTMFKRSIVSKSYFEKYVCETFGEYIVDGKYILREWIYTDLV